MEGCPFKAGEMEFGAKVHAWYLDLSLSLVVSFLACIVFVLSRLLLRSCVVVCFWYFFLFFSLLSCLFESFLLSSLVLSCLSLACHILSFLFLGLCCVALYCVVLSMSCRCLALSSLVVVPVFYAFSVYSRQCRYILVNWLSCRYIALAGYF